MPANTIVGRVTRGEFFAVLAPGFFIFVVAYAAFNATGSATASPPSLWKVLEDLSSEVGKYPALLVFIIFGAYLLGSILRALPVGYVERMIPPFRTKFPHADRLREVRETLKKHDKAAMIDPHLLITLPDDDLPMHVYNYWKDVLAVCSPEGFQHYETFETRVRFFGGIFWAALFGIASSLYLTVQSPAFFPHPTGGPLFIISAVLLLSFGSQFRRIRKQEAGALLMIFTAYHQRCESKKGEAKP